MMMADNDAGWPSKLQAAVLSANIHRKLSTDYSPFQLMFGRNFDHLPLLRLLKLDTLSSANLSEDETSSENDSCWIVDLEQQRVVERANARTNIKIKQGKQKRSYDLKVDSTR